MEEGCCAATTLSSKRFYNHGWLRVLNPTTFNIILFRPAAGCTHVATMGATSELYTFFISLNLLHACRPEFSFFSGVLFFLRYLDYIHGNRERQLVFHRISWGASYEHRKRCALQGHPPDNREPREHPKLTSVCLTDLIIRERTWHNNMLQQILSADVWSQGKIKLAGRGNFRFLLGRNNRPQYLYIVVYCCYVDTP